MPAGTNHNTGSARSNVSQDSLADDGAAVVERSRILLEIGCCVDWKTGHLYVIARKANYGRPIKVIAAAAFAKSLSSTVTLISSAMPLPERITSV